MPHHAHHPPAAEASLEEAKAWLESIDTNKDGVISKQELVAALQKLNVWFPGFRSWLAIKNADFDGNDMLDLCGAEIGTPSNLDAPNSDGQSFKEAYSGSYWYPLKRLKCSMLGNRAQAPPPEATIEEVKAWVKRIDTNNDGIISKQELAAAIRGLHLWFARWRARCAVKEADINRNGLIDTPDEFLELESFVKSHWGHLIGATHD
ncbi:uncharacterized protein LOC131224015 [Magnolia sinica]|uniref:uncharacterized protein LOC131224015 n=1 Tax=Magnolia sinica TaxID=86752 RepID=UPI002657FB3D|nr:uncharacterized protein LOC131224015 [Magnolia sinica]